MDTPALRLAPTVNDQEKKLKEIKIKGLIIKLDKDGIELAKELLKDELLSKCFSRSDLAKVLEVEERDQKIFQEIK